MKKRILSMLLGLVLTVGMIPITSMTAGATTTPNTAVEKVQAMLDALPTVGELKDADEATVNAAYEAVQADYDALEALRPEEQEQITSIEKMTALMDWFNGQVEVLVEQPPVSYVDENGETQTCNDYTIVTGSTTTLGNEGREMWYYVDGNVTISGELMTYGDLHLILKDGATLTVNGGVTIKDEAYLDEYNSNLTIYGQENQTGKLVANGISNGIHIDSYGALTINGGVVEAIGGVDENSGSVAGETQIVTASYGIRGTYVIINSGKVTAIGGTATPYNEEYNATYSGGISVWELRVNGGEVTAISGTATGDNGESYGIQANLTITDGTVVAKSAVGKAMVFTEYTTLTPPTNYWWRVADNANYKTQNVQYTDSDLTGMYFELVSTKPANNIEPYVTDVKATVTYGDAVSNGVINGNTNVEGTFVWKNVTSYGDASATPKKFTATFTPSVSGYVPVDVEVSVTVNKADQVAPTGITNTAETVDGKADGKITGVTSAMEYRKYGDTNYAAITDTEITDLADGKYYVRYKADANHNASADTEVTIAAGRKLTVTVPVTATQIGYTLTASKTALVWNDSVELTFALANGYSKLDTFAVNVNGNPVTLDANGKYTVTDVQSDITITVVGVVNNNNHSNLNHIEAKSATAEAEGNIEYWHCEDCNKYFSDKDCKNEITLADTVIAKLSDSKAPATGDNGNIWMWFVLLFVSAGGLLGTTAYKRKRNQKQII